MPSDQTSSTQASGSCSFSLGSNDLSVDEHLFYRAVPQSIRKLQPDDGDIVSEILLDLNLKQLSAQEDFIEFYYVIYYFLWYFLFLG
jgi:hypothetical protein